MPKTKSILTISSFTEHKELVPLIREIAPILQDKNYSWNFIGENRLDPRYFNLVRLEAKKFSFINILGRVSEEKKMFLLNSSSILLHGSSYESYGICI